MSRVVRPIPLSEESPLFKRISWWIENSLVRGFKRFLNDARDTFRQLFSASVGDVLEETEQDIIAIIRPFADQILSIPNLPTEIRQPIQEALSGRRQGGIAVVIGLVAMFITYLGDYLVGPFGRKVESQVDSVVQSRLFDPATLVALRVREFIDSGQLTTYMRANGLTDASTQALLKLARPLFDDNTLTTLYWRGEVTQAYVRETMRHKGYSDEDISLWLTTREIIPSPTDLVSMAVREAFDDRVAAQFGYDDNYPSEAASWAEKGGLPQEWFKRYWRAHWTLPGITQVREMFNRGIIDTATVDSYLLAADLPVFWRNALTQWFKTEVTRVDLRRIYSLGLIGTQEVYERYLKLGYTANDAALLTEWTAAEYLEEDRNLTKTDILGMYENGILNEQESNEYLSALGYTQDAIMLLLAQRDLKRQDKYERQIIDNVRKLYLNGLYDRTDVYDALGKLDTPATFIHQSLEVWDLEIQNRVTIPTTAQLRDMAQEGIISISRFRVEMSNRGYNNEYIGWYEQLWGLTSD